MSRKIVFEHICGKELVLILLKLMMLIPNRTNFCKNIFIILKIATFYASYVSFSNLIFLFLFIFFSGHDPCDPNPCWNGNCTNTTPGNFNCSCPLYSGGKRCTTCLLYTSPSPRDKRQSRMPSSA